MVVEIARLRGSQFDPGLVDAFLPLAYDLHAALFAPRAPEKAVLRNA